MERVRRREWLGSIAPTDRRIRENSNSTFSQNPKKKRLHSNRAHMRPPSTVNEREKNEFHC